MNKLTYFVHFVLLRVFTKQGPGYHAEARRGGEKHSGREHVSPRLRVSA